MLANVSKKASAHSARVVEHNGSLTTELFCTKCKNGIHRTTVWYFMVLTCIDTVVMIPSDWRYTGAGLSEYLKKVGALGYDLNEDKKTS